MEANGKVREKTPLSRVFSSETLIFCVGLSCVAYGVADGVKVMQIFFGICIVGGSVMLHFVRKKDWDAHWAELDRVKKAHEQRMIDEKDV